LNQYLVDIRALPGVQLLAVGAPVVFLALFAIRL
jgi:hypothetical protein